MQQSQRRILDQVSFRHAEKGRVNLTLGVAFVCRISAGLILLIAAVPKILHPHQFLESVYAYELVGPDAGLAVAIGLPVLEFLVGSLLVIGIAVPAALTMAILLGLLFIFVQITAISRGLDVVCGCFLQSSASFVDYSSVSFSIIFTLITAASYIATFLLLQGEKVKEDC